MVQRKPRLAVPGFLDFQHPRLVEKPPAGEGWGHEIKLDGYRVQLRVEKGAATLYSRNAHERPEWLGDFDAIAARLPDCIIDAELCALKNGLPDFSTLRSCLAKGQTERLVLFAFDLLWLGTEDQRPFALPVRKALLSRVIEEAGAVGRLALVEALPASGTALFKSACAQGLEGIVSKRLDVGYKAGRGETWTKAKCRPGQEVVIGGWKTEGSRFIGLLCGVYDGDRLTYAGTVKNGVGAKEYGPLMKRLAPLADSVSPFVAGDPPRKTSDIHWARPDLVANVEIAEWTGGGKLRQASYKGLREDKAAHEVVREIEAT